MDIKLRLFCILERQGKSIFVIKEYENNVEQCCRKKLFHDFLFSERSSEIIACKYCDLYADLCNKY